MRIDAGGGELELGAAQRLGGIGGAAVPVEGLDQAARVVVVDRGLGRDHDGGTGVEEAGGQRGPAAAIAGARREAAREHDQAGRRRERGEVGGGDGAVGEREAGAVEGPGGVAGDVEERGVAGRGERGAGDGGAELRRDGEAIGDPQRLAAGAGQAGGGIVGGRGLPRTTRAVPVARGRGSGAMRTTRTSAVWAITRSSPRRSAASGTSARSPSRSTWSGPRSARQRGAEAIDDRGRGRVAGGEQIDRAEPRDRAEVDAAELPAGDVEPPHPIAAAHQDGAGVRPRQAAAVASAAPGRSAPCSWRRTSASAARQSPRRAARLIACL